MRTNPPVTGRRVEQAIAADGSHIYGRAPSLHAAIHSLLHGRVLIQSRPGLPDSQVRALDRLVRDDPDRVVGFENQTGMTAAVPPPPTSACLPAPASTPTPSTRSASSATAGAASATPSSP